MLHPVFPDLQTTSWKGPGHDAPRFDAMDLEEALQARHKGDAFATAYVVVDADGSCWTKVPRLTNSKSREALASIREAGGDVMLGAVFVDLDRNPHEPWPDKGRGAREYVEAIADALPDCAVYSTLRGIRVVFRLRRLVSVEDFPKVARIAARDASYAAKKVGAPVLLDESCYEWDRFARLPYVVRDGDASEAYCVLRIPEVWSGWFPGASALDEVSREVDTLTERLRSTDDRPAGVPDLSEETEALAEGYATWAPAASAKAMRAVLDGQPFYERGERNNATFKFLSSFLGFCSRRGKVPEPADLYALLYRSVAKSQGTSPDSALSETWSMAVRLNARERAKGEVLGRVRANALTALRASQPIIVYTNKTRWVYNPETGSYGSATSDTTTLMAEVGGLHPVASMNDEGKQRPMHDILREYGQRVERVRMVLGQSKARLIEEPGGRKVLEVGVAPIVPVRPTYHPACAEYLERFAAGAGADGPAFMAWLATATQLQHPSTALVLHGASGAGKGMIAEALAVLFGGKTPFSKAMERFNSGMMESALIHLDEGVDSDAVMTGVANRFREVVGGGTISVEQKGIDPVDVRGNYRVIVTANNKHPLPVRNTSTLDDFRAIANRVLAVWADHDVASWISSRGGRSFTDDWVTLDAGDAGTLPGKLVEHLAWLAQNPPTFTRGDRFLVPANVGAWHVKALMQGILRDILTTVGRNACIDADSARRIVQVSDGCIWAAADEQMAKSVNALSGTTHETVRVVEAVRESLRTGRPRAFPVGGGTKVMYPMPSDLVLALVEPEDPDVFVVEAEQAARLRRALGLAP